MVNPCMMKPVSNPPCLSPQITPVEDKHQKAATRRVMLMHPVHPIVLLRLAAWDPPKKMLLWDLPMGGGGSQPVLWARLDQCITVTWAQGGSLHPPTTIQVTERSKPKSRICSACMRLTTTRREEPGWTNSSRSWRTGERLYLSAQQSPKTH